SQPTAHCHAPQPDRVPAIPWKAGTMHSQLVSQSIIQTS
ncbi:unnamed protein product, partial [Rotaria socialis]